MVPSYFIIFLLLLIIVAVAPGTVMGWIAAKRIRESNGALYGMRLAALAALPLPMFLGLAILLLLLVLMLRAAFVFDPSGSSEWLVFIPVLATGLILLIKLFGTLQKNLTKGEPIISGFFSRINRTTVITLILIWLISGGLFTSNLIRSQTPPKPIVEPPAAAGEASEGELRFGPEHEMTIPYPRSGSRTAFLDLDTRGFIEGAAVHHLAKHRFNPAVSKPPEADRKIEEWASGHGADLMFVQIKPKVITALYGGPMAYQPALDYDSATPVQVLKAARTLPETAPAGKDQPHVTLFGPQAGETIVFRTREGGIGLLELRESPELPRGGLVVRYKTIREAR